jgi:hypothetical protein
MAESPTFPVTIHYFGRAVPIAPDPMAAYWVRGVVGGLGLLAITDLGLLVLALGWPASVVPPWAQHGPWESECLPTGMAPDTR